MGGKLSTGDGVGSLAQLATSVIESKCYHSGLEGLPFNKLIKWTVSKSLNSHLTVVHDMQGVVQRVERELGGPVKLDSVGGVGVARPATHRGEVARPRPAPRPSHQSGDAASRRDYLG